MVASTIEDRNKGFHLGADSYILKPFEQSDLIRELKTLTAGDGEHQVCADYRRSGTGQIPAQAAAPQPAVYDHGSAGRGRGVKNGG